MNTAKLERMVAVYEAGSFRKASIELGISQPALTWSIRQLEEELNARLFERGPRGIRPTAVCEKLMQRARLIVREEERMLADAALTSQSLALQVGVHPSIFNGAFARCITRFGELAPHVILRIREGYSAELIERLEHGELDFAYCAIPGSAETDGHLEIERVATLDYSVVARPHHPVFDDIAAGRPPGGYPWARFDANNIVGAFTGMGDVGEVLANAGHDRATQMIRTPSMSLIKLLVLEGDHLGLIADEYVTEELATGKLLRLPGCSITASQMGFLTLQGSYETTEAQKLKGLLRRLAQGGQQAPAPTSVKAFAAKRAAGSGG